MFDQQIFEWRATGNRTHEALLYPALQLHVEWAHDCFDADSNGLYHSYINTWPTDSVWFNGAETWEETSYMFTAHVALVEMATRAGDTDAAKRYQAVVDIISKNWRELWIVATGEPAAGREEGGHRRLRPDAWLYSIFCPIEARMIDSETAAQALYYTEVRLERDTVECTAPHGTTIPCGERVWTSNWVPSLWSVRQMWPGDNFATANAYYIAGLPRGGWDLLRGSMNHDMLQTVVPGLLGGNNGGTVSHAFFCSSLSFCGTVPMTEYSSKIMYFRISTTACIPLHGFLSRGSGGTDLTTRKMKSPLRRSSPWNGRIRCSQKLLRQLKRRMCISE
jgi:hypothetical protein